MDDSQNSHAMQEKLYKNVHILYDSMWIKFYEMQTNLTVMKREELLDKHGVCGEGHGEERVTRHYQVGHCKSLFHMKE